MPRRLVFRKGTRALAPVRRPPRRGVRSAALPVHPPPKPPPVPVQQHAPSSSPGAFSVNQTRPSPVRLPQRPPLRHLRILPVLAAISVVSASSFLRSVGVASASRCSPILGGVPCPLRSAPPESGPAERTTTQIGSRPSLSSSLEPPPARPATDLQVLTDLYAQITA